jgi:hypothetical protein
MIGALLRRWQCRRLAPVRARCGKRFPLSLEFLEDHPLLSTYAGTPLLHRGSEHSLTGDLRDPLTNAISGDTSTRNSSLTSCGVSGASGGVSAMVVTSTRRWHLWHGQRSTFEKRP